MQLSHLQKLMRAFQDHQPTRPHIPEDTPTYRRWELEKEEREPGLLNSDEFKAAVADVLGTNQFDDQLETLFTKVNVVHLIFIFGLFHISVGYEGITLV